MTSPDTAQPTVYEFADLTLDTGRRAVLRGTQVLDVGTLNFDLLRVLADVAPNVVTTDQLAEKVWGRHFVSPENAAQRIMLLRQSLGDDASQPRYVETVRNKGYRLIPPVTRASQESAPTAAPTAHRARLRLAAAAAALLAAAGVTWWVVNLAGVPTPKTPLSSIAVLPCKNLSPDPADGYFAAGLHEALLDQLINVRGLRVASLISVQTYADTDKPVRDIARELSVATVLECAVRSSEGRVRIDVRLSDVATSSYRLSKGFERTLDAVLSLQSNVALEVAQALETELLPAERTRLARLPTTSAEAYNLYLSALAREYREQREEMLRAIADVERALTLDPKFVEAWILDSNLSTTIQFLDPERAREHVVRGEESARRAIALDPDSGRAHAMLAYALSLRSDWRGGEAEYRKARSLNVPVGDIPALAVQRLAVGDFNSAREVLRESHEVAPQNATPLRFLVLVSAYLGDWNAVDALYANGKALHQPWRAADDQMIHLEIARGQADAARRISAETAVNAAMLERLDSPDAALKELRRQYAALGPTSAVAHRDVAVWAAHFGDSPLAIEALRAALDEAGGQLIYVWLPQLKELRHMAEFKALLRDFGAVAYWREYGWSPVCRPLAGDDFECD